MKLTINGTTYEMEDDVRLIHDLSTNRVFFEFPGTEQRPLVAQRTQRALALEAPAEGNVVLANGPPKMKGVVDPGTREKVLAVLREVGASSTRGITWRVLGRKAASKYRDGLHRLLFEMMQAGDIAGHKRRKNAQMEYYLKEAVE